MKRTIRRILFAAALATVGSTSAQAASYTCGVGTINIVAIGAWSWEGLHLRMEFEEGRAPDAGSMWSTHYVRVLKSTFSDPDDFKTMKAALLMAYANGHRIQLKTNNLKNGVPDCTQVREVFMYP